MSYPAFDDADGFEGSELVEGAAQRVGAVVEFLELLVQGGEKVEQAILSGFLGRNGRQDGLLYAGVLMLCLR